MMLRQPDRHAGLDLRRAVPGRAHAMKPCVDFFLNDFVYPIRQGRREGHARAVEPGAEGRKLFLVEGFRIDVSSSPVTISVPSSPVVKYPSAMRAVQISAGTAIQQYVQYFSRLL